MKPRIKRFVDEFIRSEYVANLTEERDRDFINEPERAARCADGAEEGWYGATHSEIIGDWRDAFRYWVREHHKTDNDLDRFEAAVTAHFDEVEAWHEQNGTLFEEIG